jgi:hypothetical protein
MSGFHAALPKAHGDFTGSNVRVTRGHQSMMDLLNGRNRILAVKTRS